MKVGRQYIGKLVEMTWRDPGEARLTLTDPSYDPKGRGCLASWRERGFILDVTEGVVKIEHSRAVGAPMLRQPDESTCSFVPEELVESITVYEPVREPVA